MSEIGRWLEDSLYLAKGHFLTFSHKEPPSHYLEYTKEGKPPIVLIPGIAAKWGMLKEIGDKISMIGHSIYVLPDLGYNFYDFPTSVEIIKKLIDKNNLNNVILVGHSKGGLVGKYMLVYENKDNKISGLVAIATPFSGASLSGLVPAKSYKETTPESKIIKDLNLHPEVNDRIVSIYSTRDNLVSNTTCYLKGSRNIEIDDNGHHKILFNKDLPSKIAKSIDFYLRQKTRSDS